jgi:glycosyltransferase involved in cell wall biosynthesis
LSDRVRNPKPSAMKILFTFENPLGGTEADAEVFVTTARYLAASTAQSWLHVPGARRAGRAAEETLAGMSVVRAWAPLRPAVLRHFCCGLTLVLRPEFRQADLVYTRNLWMAWLALLFGQRVVFDHYRPWPDQIPPLQLWIHRLICHRRFLVNISHSEYTRARYLDIGIPPDKLCCVRNGFEPSRLAAPLPLDLAKRRIGVDSDQKTVVYTGRINHKKGLELVIEAARRLPDHVFILVGSQANGVIEALASTVANVRIVPWQSPETIGRYIFAADVLLIPPSLRPLAEFGSTVIPLKLYLYLASGRPILAGDTPDLREVLQHGRNALLCRPDCVESLVAGIRALTRDPGLGSGLAARALADSRDLTWGARARRIAAIVGERLGSEAPRCSHWGRVQTRAWVRQSCRWAMHLIRKRSWILPPRAAFAASPVPRPGEASVVETRADRC